MEEQHLPLTEQEKRQMKEKPLKPSINSGGMDKSSSDIMQTDIDSLTDNVKNDPENDCIQYESDFININATSVREDPESIPEELESTEPSNPDTMEPISETDQQDSKAKEPKVKRKIYSESYLQETVNQVRNRTITLYAASRLTGIPRGTIQYRLSALYKNKGTPGPCTIFTPIEEKDIVKRINDMILKGFPIKRNRIQFMVANYVRANPRKTPFKDNRPGKQWVKFFARRNSDLRIPKFDSENVSQQYVRNWFCNVQRYLEDNQLTDILKDPSRIINASEAGFMLHPTLSKGIVEKYNYKDVSFIETTTGHHNITVMFTFIADGSFVPPGVILPMKRLTQDLQQSLPSGWVAGRSENGRLDARNFTLYVRKVLYPTLVERGTQFPVLYFVDGHYSEAAFEAADICKQYGIVLIALYPNAAQIIQQSNATAFNVLKTTWTSAVKNWRKEHKTKRMSFRIFGSLLEKAMDKTLKPCTITYGFSLCGLYPFDSNEINFEDYSNIFTKSSEANNEFMSHGSKTTDPTDETAGDSVDAMDIKDESNNRTIEVPENVLKTALTMLSPLKKHLYQTPVANLSLEDKILSYMYNKILIRAESPVHDTIQKSTDNYSPSNTGETCTPNEDTACLDFDIAMDIKTEDDSLESTESLEHCGRENTQHCDTKNSKVDKNCQQEEINSNSSGETNNGAIHFATEHICSFPRITIHFCPTTKKTKYHSFFMDSTGMYMTYLEACRKSSQKPVSGKVYNDIMLQERTKDPPLPSRCVDCQHVEKYEFSSTLFERIN